LDASRRHWLRDHRGVALIVVKSTSGRPPTLAAVHLLRWLLSSVVVALLTATPAGADVVGRVLTEGGQPIAGARVSREASGQAVVTDGAGAFTLPSAAGPVSLVAAARGYFHAARTVAAPAADVALTMIAVPTEDDPAYALAPPSTCAPCHPTQVAEWTGSPMAQAGANTWVYDLYDGTGTAGGSAGFVYTRDSRLAPHNPASECASCHQPEPWAQTPFVAMLPLAQAGQQHGVSCEVCHRLAELDETKVNYPGLFPGVVRLARSTTAGAIQFGLLGDVAYTAGPMRPSYQPQLAAAVCAACHQDKNDPDEDGDFEEPDGVISEPTYLEWLASRYADPSAPDRASCVDCHMAPTHAAAACGVYAPPQARPDGQLRSHRIEGTTAAFLEAAVSVQVDAALVDGELAVDVAITNDRTGHHVPTGVTVRNMILLVTARRTTDGAALTARGDQVVSELGGVGDPAAGYVAGLPGKLYAKVPVDAAGHGPVFFTEAAALGSDNRIPAHGVDRTQYRFALPPDGGPIEIEARVIYRRAFRAVVDAKGWTTDGHGRPLEDLQAPHFGHLMARATAAIDAPAADDGCGCASGPTARRPVALTLVTLALALRRRRRR
jgi:MYXO-CTERM domain-containing protein